MPTVQPRPPACHFDCPGCPESEADPIPDSVPLAGWSLAGTSLLIFLVPLLFALAGAAVISRSNPAAQLLGCVAGLIFGVVIVRSVFPTSSEIEKEPE